MGRSARLARALACLLVAIALSLGFGAAWAGADDQGSQAPSVVRELPGKRTEYSTTYLLSDGSFRTSCYQSPVYYKDAAGDWQPIDASLIPIAGIDTYATAAAPVKVTLADEAPGQKPVTVEAGKYALTMNLVGCAEDDKLILGDSAMYFAVAAATDVTYTATGDGVKEVLTLASNSAPSVFTYRLTHPGLTAKQDESGQWGLYAAGAAKPAFLLGAMNACDSSLDESGVPAWCDAARMSVTPSVDASTVTFSVPRSWLADPARVYPVKIDPEIHVITTEASTDTYISSGYPSTAFGSDQSLFCGKVSTATGSCKTLVKFLGLGYGPDHATIPDGAHVSTAGFSVRQYWQPATHDDTLAVGRVSNDSTAWGEASNWNSSTINVVSLPSFTTQAAQDWVDIPCTSVVQEWERDQYANKGFVLYESSSAGNSWARKFRSGEYSDVSYQPRMNITWEQPTMSASGYQSSYRIGDTVYVTIAAASVADPSQISEIRMGVNRADSDASHYRGVLAWFKDAPAAGTIWENYVAAPANGGYLAYCDSASSGFQYITPKLSECTVNNASHTSITFAFQVGDTWGDQQANHFDSELGMTAGGADTWYSGWIANSGNVNILPKPITSVSKTVTPSSKFFIGVGANDTADSGRGSVSLTWGPSPLATGYNINLWDGVKYDQVATTTSTSWSSSGKNLFPTDTEINANIAQGYAGNPFASSHGTLDLRDNPNALYNKMLPAGQSTTASDYRFVVVPYNAKGALAVLDNVVTSATLPGRSVASMDAAHTTSDLGSWDGHSLACELDDGRLTANVTDLSIASLGPAAAVSRSYLSAQATTKFAPGWFFGFEQNLDLSNVTGSPNRATYTDEGNVGHTFYRSDSSSPWQAPNGFFATLTPSGSNWKLAFDDQRVLTFNSSGALTSEAGNAYDDAQGTNLVTYSWGTNALTITAANGQHIDVAFASGKVTSASYATSDGTRTVTYSGSSPTWQVVYNAGSGVARTVSYAYGANSCLAQITQEAWPASGQSAILKILYSGNKVSELDYPDMFTTDSAHTVAKSDAKATVTYDSATQATVKRYGTVAGTANQVMKQVVETWSPSSDAVPNQQLTEVESTSAGQTTTSYTYADDLQVEAVETTKGSATVAKTSAQISDDVIRGSHDVLSETITASTNQTTSYAYDAQHRVTSETNAKGTTTYAYDAYSNVSEEQVKSDATTWISDTQRSYDAQGHLTMEKSLISGTPSAGSWVEIDYSNFYASGQPGTTVAKDVKLTHGGSTQNLTKTTTYDAFGNLLTESDWGARTTATNTYDLAGRMLTSADAAGVVTHTFYDLLGNATETYRTAAGTSKKADWRVSAFDPMGRALTMTTKLSDASGSPTTQSVVTSTYDGAGDQLSSADSTVGGQPEKWLYDASGNVTEHWALGVANYTDAARSTRTSYDASARLTGESAPGNSVAPGPNPDGSDPTLVGGSRTAYDAAGQAAYVISPDRSRVDNAYDGDGNQTLAESTVSGTTTSVYGASGRLASRTDERGFATSSAYDLLGRANGAAGSGQSQTTTEYNVLGWVLQELDASGVTTSSTYDTHGEVVSETIGTQGAADSVYDSSTGLLSYKTDSNGSKLTYTYDAFGNVSRALHQDWNNATVKDVTTSFDSLGRPTSSAEAGSGRSQSWTYPVNTATGVQETLSHSAQTSTQVTRNARDMETGRVTTIGSGVTVSRAVTDPSGRDAADRWTSATITQTGSAAQTLSRGFDNAGRVSAQGGAGFTGGGSYSYNATSGLQSGQSLPLALGGAINDAYTYWGDGRLSTWNAAAAYSFSLSGNLTADSGTGTTYTYDAVNRLTQSLRSGATTYYGWDAANGWRTCQGQNPNPTPANEPIVYTYVKNGSTTSNGRMTRYQNSATSTDASYTYDALGQRAKSAATVSGTTTTTSYDYDGITLMSLAATQGASTWRIDYLYDEESVPYGGVYSSPVTSTAPTAFTMITNNRGDVLELLDASGNAFASYRYDPWGSPTGPGNYATGVWTSGTSLVTSTLAGQIASRQILRYAGYAFDSESSLYYCSARSYDPTTRQWTTGDSAKADGEESAYQYCAGDPINRVDPSGQAWLWDAIKSWTRRTVHYAWRLHWSRYTQWVREWRKGERVVERARRVTQAEEDAHIQAEWNRMPASQRQAGIATLRGHSHDDSIDLSKVTWQEKIDWAYLFNKIGKYETGKWFKTSVRVAYYYLVWAPRMIWYSFWVLQPL